MSTLLAGIGFSVVLCASGPPHDDHGEPPKLVKLRAFPASIELFHADDHKRFIVVAEFEDGTTRDVTSKVKLSFSPGTPVSIDARFVLHATQDGEGQLSVSFDERKITVPIQVTGAKRHVAASFQNDVIPVLTKSGCNAGTCHGSAAGKNGFGLSLFGYNPKADHIALTRGLRGRRSNSADPDASLMLTKPLRKVSHKGGKRLVEGSRNHKTLRAWIAQGAIDDLGKATPLTGIALVPSQVVFAGKGQTQRLMVHATYADGTSRDVTDLAQLSSNNEPSATVSERGVVSSSLRGEAFVMARYGGFAEVAQVLVVPTDDDYSFPDIRPVNYIDEAMFAKQRRMRLAPTDVCDDATFLRRVYLDIINLPPTATEARQFLGDKDGDVDADKRRKLVARLLERPEFPDVQAMQWSELLRIESRRLERKGMHVYTEFLRDAFRDRVPFDQLVRELLVAKGSNFRNPPANFYLTQRQPNLMAEDVAQNFLGIRVQCAQCHNHPFDRWTMDDYYGFSAFFARLGRKRGEHPYEFIVFPRPNGEMRNKRDNGIAQPRFLGGEEPKIERGKDRREVLATWLTDPKNPWFKTSVANRVWARFFGRGIVDPPDDVRVSNPPSHPDLYAKLGDKLVEYGFDIRRLIVDICASRTYQQKTGRGTSPGGSFAEAHIRRLSAEQLLDAISLATGITERYRNLPSNAKATQVEDGNPRNRFLDVFGRPRRTSACTCDRSDTPTLSQSLHLINGQTIARRIRDNKGRLRRMLIAKAKAEEILEELFLSTYSRRPTDAERKRLLAVLNDKKQKRWSAFEDIFWAMLNSKEFLFNH